MINEAQIYDAIREDFRTLRAAIPDGHVALSIEISEPCPGRHGERCTCYVDGVIEVAETLSGAVAKQIASHNPEAVARHKRREAQRLLAEAAAIDAGAAQQREAQSSR